MKNEKKTIVQLNNVSFSYKGVDKKEITALKDVSFEIKEGDFVAVIGHNGSGKSTMAKLLNGLLKPLSGDVFVNGINTKNKSEIFNIRSIVGMVFQNPDNQMIASIVEDDIAFGPENLGIEREEIIRRVDFALEAVGMSEYRNKTPFKMSGGQKQRIAIAGVLAMMPKVLVLDESTAMLDPKGRDEVMDVIRKLNKENNMTVILITHYMDEALKADKILVFNEAQIVLQGSANEVFSQYDMLQKIKLRFPLDVELLYTLKTKGIDLGDNILTTEEMIDKLCLLK